MRCRGGGGGGKRCNWDSSELSSCTISPPPPPAPCAIIITFNNICLCWGLYHKNHIISLYYYTLERLRLRPHHPWRMAFQSRGQRYAGIQREGAEGVPTPHYLLLAARGDARRRKRHSWQLSAMFHLNRWCKNHRKNSHPSSRTESCI